MKPGMAYFVPTRTNHSYRCDSNLTKLFFHLNLFRSDRYDLFRGVERILEIPMPPNLLEVMKRAYAGNTFADGMIAGSSCTEF